MFDVKDVAKWFILKNNAEMKEHISDRDEYEVYEGISHLKLQKLIYNAQGLCLAIFDRPLFDAKIMAWQHGPVVPEIYAIYKANGKENITDVNLTEKEEQNIAKLENDNIANTILNMTYDNFAIYTAWQLRELSHSTGSPWDIIESTSGIGSEIPQNIIGDYFKKEVVE